MSQHSAQQQQQQQRPPPPPQQQQEDDLQSEHHSDSPPPQPLLRPAQGAWSAYNFTQRRQPESTSDSTRATSSSRLTHPESAQRHSQGGSGSTIGATQIEQQHPPPLSTTTTTTRRQSPTSASSTRSYSNNYYPNAAYTQPSSNTPSHAKSRNYYRSMSPIASQPERDNNDHQISQSQQQRNSVEAKEKDRERDSQQHRSHIHYRHHHRRSPSPTTFSSESTHSPSGNVGPRNQSAAPSPSTTPAAITVHSSISQIIAATQSGASASSSSGSGVVRDSPAGNSSQQQQQQQRSSRRHSSSPPIASFRPSGSFPEPTIRKPAFPHSKSSSNSGTMYPFNSLPPTTRIPDIGGSGGVAPNADRPNESSADNPSLPDHDAPGAGAFANDPALSSTVPDMTSPMLPYPPPMTEQHRPPQTQVPQSLPPLTGTLSSVQTQTQPPLSSQGHTQTQALTPTITPTSSVPPPSQPQHVQPQIHAQPPPSSHPQEIIVLLMEDIRFTGPEDPDFQLAEVSVSLREGSSSGSGDESGGTWWADGEDVIKALQMTTSRLEGSAKVFARRGKYRQCFVRISDDGTMECQPSSLLMVTREKTIELIIESNFESRPPHDLYSYHRAHPLAHQHPAAFPAYHPLQLHARGLPPRLGMNMNLPSGVSPAGMNMGGGMPYEEYYRSPTPTHPHSHLHPQGPSYPIHIGHPQSYYAGGNGGNSGMSPTLGQKRNHEEDPPANKRPRTNNVNGSGGGGGGGGSGNGSSAANFGVGHIVGVGMGMNNVSGMAGAASSSAAVSGSAPNLTLAGQQQGGSSATNTNSVALMEGVIPSGPNSGGGGSGNGLSNSGNTSSSVKNRGVGLSRPNSRGAGTGANPSSSSGTNNNGASNNPGLSSTNPLSINIVPVGVRSNAPLGLGNVASGRLRGSASGPPGSGSGAAGTSSSSGITGTGNNNQAQRPASPEEYTSTSTIFPPMPSRMGNSTFVNHPGGKAPKEIINAAIVAYLRSHIQNEEGYIEFAASKGRLLPIPELLRGYRFAARIVTTWANRKTPPTAEGCGNKRITKNHVLQALFRQTSWGSDCEQTLQLADKYGPAGPFEDPRVVEILNGGSMLPEKGSLGFGGVGGTNGAASGGNGVDGLSKAVPGRSQGSVALLDFLKDVDREYKLRGGAVKKSPVSASPGNGEIAATTGGGPNGGSRRTSAIAGNPYPSLHTTNGDGDGTSPPPPPPAAAAVPPPPSSSRAAQLSGHGFISPSSPTSPARNLTPALSPHPNHAASPAGTTAVGVGGVTQTQAQTSTEHDAPGSAGALADEAVGSNVATNI